MDIIRAEISLRETGWQGGERIDNYSLLYDPVSKVIVDITPSYKGEDQERHLYLGPVGARVGRHLGTIEGLLNGSINPSQGHSLGDAWLHVLKFEKEDLVGGDYTLLKELMNELNATREKVEEKVRAIRNRSLQTIG